MYLLYLGVVGSNDPIWGNNDRWVWLVKINPVSLFGHGIIPYLVTQLVS